MVYTERCINYIRYIVLQHPLEGGVQVRIHGLYIQQVDRLVQQHLVERHRETTINIMPMEHSDSCKKNILNENVFGSQNVAPFIENTAKCWKMQ